MTKQPEANTTLYDACQEILRLEHVNAELLEALKDVTVSLIAAHSLLQHGGKQAAASDKMFFQMLKDYEKSFKKGRAVFAKATGESNE